MYKLDLPVDMKESAAIERRRNRELQRQSRIFNARVRTIGVRAMYQKTNDMKGTFLASLWSMEGSLILALHLCCYIRVNLVYSSTSERISSFNS